MSISVFILFAGLFLSYSNGANDNFKGVATLFGSGASNYKRALYWATFTTFFGSLAALFFSKGLVAVFSGKGLVPNLSTEMPLFLFSLGLGSALTIYLATLTGFPISTTHALVGGLICAGLAVGQNIQIEKLWNIYLLPLLFSPLISLILTRAFYPLFQSLREVCGINGQTCFCINCKEEIVEVTPGGAAILKSSGITLTIDQVSVCQTRYMGTLLGLRAQTVLDRVHYLSAGAVSFARGLNDAPKIAALMIGAKIFGINNAILWVGSLMVLGGLLNARKVAQTMSKKITPMNHGQGFTANLVSEILVTTASFLILPVSTTHVTCGAIFGIGMVSQKADWRMIRNILISWLITLPVAGILSASILLLLKN